MVCTKYHRFRTNRDKSYKKRTNRYYSIWVYHFNNCSINMVSTNLIKQISRRDFKKNSGHVSLLRPPSESWNTHNMSISAALPGQIGIWGSVISSTTGVQGGAPAENGFWCIWNLKKNTSDGDKFEISYFCNEYLSIFLRLETNAVDLQHLTQKFPGYTGGFLNYRRFPGVVDTLINCNGMLSVLKYW